MNLAVIARGTNAGRKASDHHLIGMTPKSVIQKKVAIKLNRKRQRLFYIVV